MQPCDDGIFKLVLQDVSNQASPASDRATAPLNWLPFTHDWTHVLIDAEQATSNWPVERDGAEAEHCGRAEEFVQELEGLAEDDGVEPPAAEGAGAQCDVKGDAHQAGADPRARHVLHKAVGHRLEDVGAAGAPQDCGVSCGEGVYMFSGNNVFTVCLSFAALSTESKRIHAVWWTVFMLALSNSHVFTALSSVHWVDV